ALGCVSHPLEGTIAAGAPAPVADAGADLHACMGAGIDLMGTVAQAGGGAWGGGSGTFSGAWPDVHYDPAPQEVANGQVQLVLTTTGNGPCPAATDTLEIALGNAFLDASLQVQHVSCHGAADGSIAFLPDGPGFTFAWDPPTAPGASAITGLGPGAWSVTVTDALGCDSTFSTTVVEPPPLAFDAIVTDVPCAGQATGTAQAVATGGTAPYTIAWADGTIGGSISGLAAGTHPVTVTDANGCTITGIVTVDEPAPIALTAHVPDTVCVGQPVQLTATATGGHGGFLYDWNGLGFSDTITVAFAAPQTVQVTVTDSMGCAGPVIMLPVHVIDIGAAGIFSYGDTIVCPGGTATVGLHLEGVAEPYTLQWQPASLQGPGPHSVPVTADTMLTAAVTDACGSTAHRTIMLGLDIVPDPQQLPPVTAVGCAPLAVTFPVLPLPYGCSFTWDLGNGQTATTSAPTVTYGAGTWPIGLTITTALGCTASSAGQGSVTVHPSPTAAFTASPWSTSMDDPEIVFTSTSGSVDHAWDFGDGHGSLLTHPAHTYTGPGTYPVELLVVDANGCTNSVTHQVEITVVHDIAIPTAFTPNPDGGNGGQWTAGALDNDIFHPFARFVEEFNMRIHNRWGELVFESNDIAIGWDGWYRGQLSPQDVYVVQCRFRFVDGQQVEKLTDLTLLR
ncbi:MAG: PKD domain-containing protein, partial [Flavobacteriales bacterium]|nr:PKD domain-containing protein [Flavobacteriales bacterium]